MLEQQLELLPTALPKRSTSTVFKIHNSQNFWRCPKATNKSLSNYLEREKVIEARTDSKGIRLDVYVEDTDTNRSFDIEMQVSDSDNISKRMRYYQGLIDLDKLKHGQHYSKLGESFIIFICPFDRFKASKHIYTFKETCVQCPKIELRDGTTKIFF